jgi:phage tail protein X
VALGAALIVVAGAGAAAWAGPGGAQRDPATREAAKACVEAAKTANPGADRATLRAAAAPCLEAAGITLRQLTPEQQARRDAFRACIASAKEANPGAERPVLRDAVKACLAESGITPGAGLGRLRQCIKDARAANPDADRATLAPIVRECMTTTG